MRQPHEHWCFWLRQSELHKDCCPKPPPEWLCECGAVQINQYIESLETQASTQPKQESPPGTLSGPAIANPERLHDGPGCMIYRRPGRAS